MTHVAQKSAKASAEDPAIPQKVFHEASGHKKPIASHCTVTALILDCCCVSVAAVQNDIIGVAAGWHHTAAWECERGA